MFPSAGQLLHIKYRNQTKETMKLIWMLFGVLTAGVLAVIYREQTYSAASFGYKAPIYAADLSPNMFPDRVDAD